MNYNSLTAPSNGVIRLVVGLLLVLGGVGGVEQSVDDSALLSAVVATAVGLVCMAWGAYAAHCYTEWNLYRMKTVKHHWWLR
jgi:hypothetical protein